MNAHTFAWAIAEMDGNNFYHQEEIDEHEQNMCGIDCRICEDI